jgi:hypothetical protein
MSSEQRALAGETEGGRSPTGVSPAKAGDPTPGVAAQPVFPDPAVSEKSERRRFTAEYKLRVLQEADRCTQPGELGTQGQRVLTCCSCKDLEHVFIVPTASSAFHGHAVLVGTLLQQGQREAIQPREVLAKMLITNA